MEEKYDNYKIELRSQEVQELLGHVPRWIIRWGTILVFLILILLFILSKVLRYPDIIHSQIQLTANVPPAELKANVDGAIKSILVSDNQLVKKDEVLAHIQSAADYDDVIWLSAALSDSFAIEQLISEEALRKRQLILGDMQSSYAAFINTLEEYQSFVDIDYYIRKLESIKGEQSKYRQYINSLNDQQNILKQEYLIVGNQYKRDSVLAVQSVLSKTELEKSEENKLKKLYELKESGAKLNQAVIQVANLEQEKLELELQLEKENKKLYSDLKSRWNELKGEISQWSKSYLIKAPFDGIVSLNKIWTENQYVEEGEIVMMVLPLNTDKIIGRILIQPSGAGKIHIKDKVIIQFDNYPYLEYGIVTGKIESMSPAPEGGLYYARVTLDSTELVTNYNNKLNFSQNMQGNAEIITESRSLFERIIAPLKSVVEIQNQYK